MTVFLPRRAATANRKSMRGRIANLFVLLALIFGAVIVPATAHAQDLTEIHASDMLANNFAALIEHCWDNERQRFSLDLTQEILRRCVVTHGGEICNETIRTAYGLPPQSASPS